MPTALYISKDHPTLPGHFPNHPVVPAVLILDLVIEEIHRRQPQLIIGGIRKAKFLQPLPVDTNFSLQCGEARGNALRFQCHVGGALLLEGKLIIANAAQTEAAIEPRI
jgi:3-hydroxyacyl-[acyl-carrier-protein] dehydratase